MKNSFFIWPGFAIFLLVIAYWLVQPSQATDRLMYSRFQKTVTDLESKLENDKQQISNPKFQTAIKAATSLEDIHRIVFHSNLQGNLVIYQRELPRYWTSDCFVPKFDMIHQKESGTIYEIRLGNRLFIGQIVKNQPDSGSFIFFSYVKVPDIDNETTNAHTYNHVSYFQSSGNPNLSQWSWSPYSREGLQLLRQHLKAYHYKGVATSYILIILIALSILGLWLHRISDSLANRNSIWQGLTLTVVSAVSIGITTAYLHVPEHIDKLLSVDSDLTDGATALQVSLGKIFIQVILLFWVLLFTFKHLRVYTYKNVNQVTKIILGAGNYFAILVGILMIADVGKNLVLESGIDFELNNVLEIKSFSFISLLIFILFQLLLFFVAQRMTRVIKRLSLSLNVRLLTIALSFLIFFPLFLYVSPGFSAFQFYLASFVFLLLFDWFVEHSSQSVAWYFAWIVVLSGFSSSLMYKYYLDADLVKRNHYARILADPTDGMLLKVISERLGQKTLSKVALDSNENLSHSELLVHLYSDAYINTYYSIDTLTETIPHLKIPLNEWDKNISFSYVDDSWHQYLIQWSDEQETSQRYLLQFTKKDLSPNSGPDRLSFKGLSHIDTYDFIVCNNGSVVNTNTSILPAFLQKGEFQGINQTEIISGEYSYWYYEHAPYQIFIQRPLYGWLKPLTLFSYIVTLLLFITGLFWVMRQSYHRLPLKHGDKSKRQWLLVQKLQFSLFFLLSISFATIALITFYYFEHNQRVEESNRLTETILELQLEQRKIYENSLIQSSNQIWYWQEKMRQRFQNHKIDLTLYQADGRAFEQLVKVYYPVYKVLPIAVLTDNASNDQSILFTPFESAIHQFGDAIYMPLAISDTEKYWISIRPKTNKLDTYTSARTFMGTLLNIYVLLLILAVFASLLLADSISRPLSMLSQKLLQFKFGKQNQPIEWNRNDELGLIIQQYNNLLKEVEKSAEILAQNEREVAWREMAKQVAHEIKNPLTPMKLSIQYLQAKINQLTKEETSELVQRVSTTLIEQIDNLNKIASEFSNFSKLPKPINEAIVMNDLVASVHDLFRKRDDINFNLYVPIDEIYVFADRSHILRILNNLIKNAIQAIPGIRKGKIDIKLFTKNGWAIIQVSDNGTGIPQDMKDKVFYPNFTTKSSGTGLGLAICKDMAEAYGGKIYFKTKENIGTDFFLELPLMKDFEADKEV